jgi:hypothetical protein
MQIAPKLEKNGFWTSKHQIVKQKKSQAGNHSCWSWKFSVQKNITENHQKNVNPGKCAIPDEGWIQTRWNPVCQGFLQHPSSVNAREKLQLKRQACVMNIKHPLSRKLYLQIEVTKMSTWTNNNKKSFFSLWGYNMIGGRRNKKKNSSWKLNHSLQDPPLIHKSAKHKNPWGK